MKALPTSELASRDDRVSTRLLHDEPNLRVIGFHLRPGQRVSPHSSPSTVLVHVVAGAGVFRGRDGEIRLGVGESLVYEPGEEHSMETEGDGALRFLAVLAPRPG